MLRRRQVLTALALPAMAGCTGAEPAGTPPNTAAGTERPTVTPPGTDGLDLREANVVEVTYDGQPGGDVRFDVTLFHDDGEDGYADWWQVETLDGGQLGRRELLHAHSTAPFTRSATIPVPADRPCVVVRGHDQTHGYGGRTTLVNLETGATQVVDQGADARTFSADDCS